MAPSSLLGTIKKAASPGPEAATPIDIKNRSQTLFDLIEMPLMPWKPDESSGKGGPVKKDQIQLREEAERQTFAVYNHINSQAIPKGQKAERIIGIYRERQRKL